MSLGGIIAKLLGKPKTQSTAPTGWGGWLDTPEGKKWEDLGEKVYGELETATVNVHTRRIIVRDGTKLKKLTVNQAVRRIADKLGEGAPTVREHLLLWLEEAADSDAEDRDEEIDRAYEIQLWIDDVQRSADLPG